RRRRRPRRSRTTAHPGPDPGRGGREAAGADHDGRRDDGGRRAGAGGGGRCPGGEAARGTAPGGGVEAVGRRATPRVRGRLTLHRASLLPPLPLAGEGWGEGSS